ncbi:MAG: AraC family transcriptional regulator, partial [Clostridia bacterium]|nr:AraC family transcriptional regulator [Clostridia bacterium]
MKNSPYATHWKSSQLMSDKRFEIRFYKDKDIQKVSLHSHDFYELYFFINGSASYIIEDAHYKLQSGDILLISPSDLHQLDINDKSESYERMVLWLNPKYLRELSSPNTNLAECFELSYRRKQYLIRDYKLSEEVTEELTALYEYSLTDSYGSDINMEIIIKKLLLSLCLFIKNAPQVLDKSRSVVSRTINFICENLDKELSLDALAEAMYISKYHLSRLFKEETNTTPHQYIIKKRLVFSKQLIERNTPIKDVYLKCGFADYTHFFRAFKHEYG